jgi:glycolate oxidase FAD binding subunit
VAFVEQATNSGCRAQAHAGSGIVIGHLPDSVTSAPTAGKLIRPLRERAERAGGSLVLLNCDDAWKPELSVFGQGGQTMDLMRRLKQQLDPASLLNPRRLFGDL